MASTECFAALLFLACFSFHTHAQMVRTINGSLVMQVNGASLTLQGNASPAATTSSATLASVADVNAAIANSISLLQPQVWKASASEKAYENSDRRVIFAFSFHSCFSLGL